MCLTVQLITVLNLLLSGKSKNKAVGSITIVVAHYIKYVRGLISDCSHVFWAQEFGLSAVFSALGVSELFGWLISDLGKR